MTDSTLGEVIHNKKISLPPVWLIRVLVWMQRFFRPEIAPEKTPDRFPAIDIEIVDNPYPGKKLLTNGNNPFLSNIDRFHSYVAEIDKHTGKLLLYRRILTKAYLFQSQANGYSYRILEKIGVNGGGHSGTHYLCDRNLKVVDSFRIDFPKSTTDLHEFLLLENGNALLLSYQSRQLDLSGIGGNKKALVYDPLIVEQTPSGEIKWCWNGKDYFDLNDIDNSTNSPDVDINAIPPLQVDYAHANALSLFSDRNILLSLKHLNCLIKINRQTKEIIWCIGGDKCSRNQFTFIDDPYNGFSQQHSARILPNNNLLLFDNGTLHSRKESRAVEYEIDEQNFTAKLIWSYSNNQHTPAQGSVERLPNGNTLIGWGFATKPFVSEITPQGAVALAMNMPKGQMIYRVYQNNK
ncbi:MAG: aryl-sulfate sulfotransferase [Cyanobacteria bacterium P01_C01_bin.72]